MKPRKIYNILLIFCISLTLFSCSEYLDKVEIADVTSDDVFKDFNSFQGYVETMYNAIVSIERSQPNRNEINVGDDCEYSWLANWDWSHNGIYINLLNQGVTEFYNPSNEYPLEFVVTNNPRHSHWGGWQAIRVANNVFQRLPELVATQEELDLIAGQAYFFRGYFHWEILKAWGNIPYVDVLLNPSSDMKIPALNFHLTAEKILDDLGKALNLLPLDWDLTKVGSRTLGNNTGRLTKGMVYAIQAEVLLYCGSPLINGNVTGSYKYNVDYCKRAAEAAWEVIKLADLGYYHLEPWASITDVFYKINNTLPGGKEVIFTPRIRANARFGGYYNTNMIFQRLGGGNKLGSPTANYVENYGMANGLPISHPLSGYNPSDPFTGRDPRFYKDLVIDREKIVESLPITNANSKAELYIGGRDRNSSNSKTGFAYKKFKHITCNNTDNGWAAPRYWAQVPRLRMAEVYLFYAEAVNEAYGPTGTHPGASLTAISAVNKVRNRSNVPDVSTYYTSNIEDFRKAVWNERAVELAWEGKRWYDIRRWYVAHLPEYKGLYALDFDKNWTYFTKSILRNRVFEMRHYWLPIPIEQAKLYEEWPQNKGW